MFHPSSSKIFALLILSIPLFAGISGSVIIDTHWSGLVIIDGDIVIEPGATLSISPGTRILIRSDFDKDPNGTEIVVRGVINANGQPGSGRIVFSALGSTGSLFQWQGIRFINAAPASLLNNCVIEYAYNGVSVMQSSPEIERCLIRYNSYAGISCDFGAAPFISRTTVAANEFCGINCELDAAPLIEKCRIAGNPIGVVIADRAQPDLGHTGEPATQSRGGNAFISNVQYDIYNQSSSTIFAENNYWVVDSRRQLHARVFDHADDQRFGPVALRSYNLLPVDNPLTEALTLAMSRDYREMPTVELQKSEMYTRRLPATAEEEEEDNAAIRQARQARQQPLDPVVYPSEQINPALLSDSKAYQDNLLDDAFKIYVNRARANYPAEYEGKRIEGSVIFEVTVGTDGSVQEYRIIHSDDELFSQSATVAIRKYRYKPGTIQGTPVMFKTIEQILFEPRS